VIIGRLLEVVVTSLTEHRITDRDLAALLLAVGAKPPIGPGVLTDSFQALDLDSLARTRIAALVAERRGVDVESRLGPGTTPEQLRRLVEGADEATAEGAAAGIAEGTAAR
jgi:hypothetical protein